MRMFWPCLVALVVGLVACKPAEGDSSILLTPEQTVQFFRAVWLSTDKGGNSVVDINELLASIPNRNMLDTITRLVDTNRDAVISYDEALNEFKKRIVNEPGVTQLVEDEISKFKAEQKLAKIGLAKMTVESIDPIMYVSADHVQKVVNANAENEKKYADPLPYDWHQLDLMCSWNLNNCTDYCAHMPTLCFETCKSVLPRRFGDAPIACDCMLPHLLMCNWPCFLRSWACTTKKLLEPCSKISKCGDIYGTQCGWCKSSSKALPGDQSGPYENECEKENWIHKASQCPCDQMTQCDYIRGSSSCGWCNSTRTALPGSASGPTDAPSCPKENWEFENPARAPKSYVQYFNVPDLICRDRCSAVTKCEEIYASNGCGWCTDVNKALSGTEAAPNKGACSGWIWNPLNCPSTST